RLDLRAAHHRVAGLDRAIGIAARYVAGQLAGLAREDHHPLGQRAGAVLRVELHAAEYPLVVKRCEQVGPGFEQRVVHRGGADDATDPAGLRRAHAHQRDDIAIVAVHALAAAGVIAARLRLDIADIDDVAQQFALVRLRHRPAEMSTEPVIDPPDIVDRIALARQPAQ